MTTGFGIDLYWLPLGAGGSFVRLNGKLYEAIKARSEHRRPVVLFHTALEVRVPRGRYIVENAWPIPKAEGRLRGVTGEGPVFSPFLGRLRAFRYEIRVWLDGRIDDIRFAVDSPQRLSDDPEEGNGSWTSHRRSRRSCGAVTTWASATCGTRTR